MDDNNTTLYFSVQVDDAETIVQKLRFLIYNAKLTSPMQLRNAFKKIISLSSMQFLDSSSFSSSNGSTPLTMTTIGSSETSMNIDSDTTMISSSNGMTSPSVSKSQQQLPSSSPLPLSPQLPQLQQQKTPEPIKKVFVDRK